MNEFITLVQGSITVEEYEHKFFKLLRFAQFTVPNEREKCRRFERSLQEDIRIIIIETECIDFGILVRVATRIEMSRREAQRVEQQQHKQGLTWPVSEPSDRTGGREMEHRGFLTNQQYNQRPEFLGG